MRKVSKIAFLFALVYSTQVHLVYSQDQNTPVLNELDEVVLDGRLGLKQTEQSQTLQVITSETLKRLGYTNLVEALQQVAGLDIRRRGVGPTQADFNLRGGTFDQTLLLIDGIRLEDAQTGHHLSNFLLPLSMIERIEIVKGPAARVYGPNAFAGAINIITKNKPDDRITAQLEVGSFGQKGAQLTAGHRYTKGALIAHGSYADSDGYRYNTDFKQRAFALKNRLNYRDPIEIIGFFNARAFGANGFYATPSATDQYEETQASLLAVSQRIQRDGWKLTPRVYWRRGQDMYEYVRNRPDIYRNMHITHKLGAALDGSVQTPLGILGVGGELARTSIQSNNLGERTRDLANFFLEHRFRLFSEAFDITPGVVFNHFSGVATRVYPGLDLGVQLADHLRVYANMGSTFRVPTFTDLYYSDRTTLGNEQLRPESATAFEIGLRHFSAQHRLSVAFFRRNSSDLIDYVKNTEQQLFQAQNIQRLTTSGFDLSYHLKVSEDPKSTQLQLGYQYLNQSFGQDDFVFSRYTIDNDLKHHFTAQVSGWISHKTRGSVNFKWVERATGRTYSVLDASLSQRISTFEFQLLANNLLNQSYWETSFIPMPGRNLSVSLQYRF